MPNSIGKKIILSCVLPLLIVAALYFANAFYAINTGVEEDIKATGAVISASLSDSGSQALISSNRDFINERSLESLVQRPDLMQVNWLTLDRKPFLSVSDNSASSKTETLEFEVYYQPLINVDTFQDDLQLDSGAEQTDSEEEKQLIGYLQLTFDLASMHASAKRSLIDELGLVALIVLITLAATTYSAWQLSQSLKKVFGHIKQLDEGHYEARLEASKDTELGQLSNSLNELANTLESNEAAIETEKERLNNAIVELTKARNETDKANDWLKRMLAVLSHEMRTPLNAVVAPIEIVISKIGNPFMTKRLENALSHVQDMLAQLDNLMDYTQLEYGEQTLHKSPTQLHKLLKNLFLNYQYVAEQKGLTLSFEVQAPTECLDAYYNVDQQRLSQIIINLVSNAIKFSHAGEISAHLKLTPINQSFTDVEVVVKDQGIGIPEPMLKGIFEMFHQADSAISRQYGGLGIGLGLSKKYADLFGGMLTVESDVNVGSTFSLKFCVENVELPPTESDQAEQIDFQVGEPLSVLIIEDNIENSNVLCQLLKKIAPNVEIRTVSDGERALEIIRADEFPYQIALVDIHLPRVSGLKIIESITTNYPNVKTVAVTADTTYNNQEACFLAGASQYIKKPVRLADMVRLVREYFN